MSFYSETILGLSGCIAYWRLNEQPAPTNLLPGVSVDHSFEAGTTGWYNAGQANTITRIATPYSTAVKNTPNLISYWRLNETSGTTAADEQGTNSGTHITSPTLGVAGAISADPNKAVLYTGGTTQRTEAAIIDTDNITLMGWFKPTALPLQAETYHWVFGTARDGTGQGGASLAVRWNGQLHGYVYVDGNTARQGAGSASNIVIAGEWQHFTMTYDGTTVRIYRNAVEVGTASVSGLLTTPLNTTAIGSQAGGNLGFNGSVDEASVWSRALTAAEISTIYSATTKAQDGSWALELRRNAAAGTGTMGGLSSNVIAVTPGESYSVIAYKREKVARSANARIIWYTAADSYISEVAGHSNNDSSGTWNQLGVGGIAPSTAARARVGVYWFSVPEGEPHWMDNVSAFVSPTAVDSKSGYNGRVWGRVRPRTYSSYIQGLNPIAYWRLDETSGATASDSSGNSLAGTYINTPTLGEAGALSNDQNLSITLSSANSESVSHPVISLSGEFTWGGFIKTASFSDTRMFAGLPVDTSTSTGAKFGHNAGKMFVRVIDNGANDQTINPPSVDEWHFVVITRDASNVVRLYIDGVASVLFSSAAQSGTVKFRMIGSNGAASGDMQYWNGSIDEVVVFDRALTAAEITEANYRAKSPLAFNTNEDTVLSFPGESWNFVQVPSTTMDTALTGITQGLSFMCWYRHNLNYDSGFTEQLMRVGGAANDFEIGINTSLKLYVAVQAGGFREIATDPTVRTGDTNWHFVVGTYDGSFVRIYVDGVNTFSEPASGDYNRAAATALGIGSYGTGVETGSVHNPETDIAEVALFNRALTQAEITMLHQIGLNTYASTPITSGETSLPSDVITVVRDSTGVPIPYHTSECIITNAYYEDVRLGREHNVNCLCSCHKYGF